MLLRQLCSSGAAAEALIAAKMSEAEATRKRPMFEQAAQALRRLGHQECAPALAVFAPGRIEVLGKHTDYCGGRSLLAAVERGICLVAVARADRQIRTLDVSSGDEAQFPLDACTPRQPGHWSDYGRSVARRIALNFGGELVGADIALMSDLPRAAGLSSSSALVVGLFLILREINQLTKRPVYHENLASLEDVAAYCATLENGESFGTLKGDNGVGTLGGSQDHTAVLCSKPGVLRQYSFCPVRHESDIALPPELTFVIASSGVLAHKTGDALQKYNSVSKRARMLVELWNAHSDRPVARLAEALEVGNDAANEQMREVLSRSHDSDRQWSLTERWEQFLTESEELIPRVAEMLRHREYLGFGDAVDCSQRLAEQSLCNQVPETIALQRAARSAGAVAASCFGAGFGGSVWAMVPKENVGTFLARWLNDTTSAAPHASGFNSNAGPAAVLV
jgi:galactokinase